MEQGLRVVPLKVGRMWRVFLLILFNHRGGGGLMVCHSHSMCILLGGRVKIICFVGEGGHVFVFLGVDMYHLYLFQRGGNSLLWGLENYIASYQLPLLFLVPTTDPSKPFNFHKVQHLYPLHQTVQACFLAFLYINNFGPFNIELI